MAQQHQSLEATNELVEQKKQFMNNEMQKVRAQFNNVS